MYCAIRSIPPTAPRPSKDRLSLLRVLLAGADPTFRLNERAFKLLERVGGAQKWRQKLIHLLTPDQEWKESQLDEWLDRYLPELGTKSRKLIKDSLAIAAYQTQTAYPVVELLVCDDAAQFRLLPAE